MAALRSPSSQDSHYTRHTSRRRSSARSFIARIRASRASSTKKTAGGIQRSATAGATTLTPRTKLLMIVRGIARTARRSRE